MKLSGRDVARKTSLQVLTNRDTQGVVVSIVSNEREPKIMVLLPEFRAGLYQGYDPF